MRLLEPSIAGAATTQLTQCSTDSFKKVRDDFQACIKTPLEYFEVAGEAIADAEENLLKATKPSVRRRLQRIIDRENRTRNRTLKSVEFCNAAFAQDRAEGEAQCQAEYPPAGGGNGGCEAGYLLCGTYCCDTAFATCEGCNGEPICCRIDGNCCG
jgi:hypothetical protein